MTKIIKITDELHKILSEKKQGKTFSEYIEVILSYTTKPKNNEPSITPSITPTTTGITPSITQIDYDKIEALIIKHSLDSEELAESVYRMLKM